MKAASEISTATNPPRWSSLTSRAYPAWDRPPPLQDHVIAPINGVYYEAALHQVDPGCETRRLPGRSGVARRAGIGYETPRRGQRPRRSFAFRLANSTVSPAALPG